MFGWLRRVCSWCVLLFGVGCASESLYSGHCWSSVEDSWRDDPVICEFKTEKEK